MALIPQDAQPAWLYDGTRVEIMEGNPHRGAADPAPVDPRRAATGVQRGYRYQTLLAVSAWLQLQPNEVLVVEGDEDFDVVAHANGTSDQRTAHQTKHEAGRLGLKSPTVREALSHFFTTFVERRKKGHSERFVFVTTAERTIDAREPEARQALDYWAGELEDASKLPIVLEFVQTRILADHPLAKDPHLTASAWADFLRAVRWNFQAPDYLRTFDDIKATLRDDPRCPNIPPDLMVARLIDELWHASASDDAHARVRTRQDLEDLLATSNTQSLEGWANTPEAARRLQALNDDRALEEALRPGIRPRPEKPRSVGDLLGAGHEVMPWDDTGRRELLDGFLEWALQAEGQGSDPASRIRVLTGEGGTGKTRLAIELIARLRRRGTLAGFFQGSSTPSAEAPPVAFVEGLLRPGRPRLVVIDYAETKLGFLGALLERAIALDGGKAPHLRILLLARHRGDWWQQLLTRVPKLADVPDPASLDHVQLAVADKERQFWQAASVFGSILDRPPTSLPAVRFEDPLYNRVLFLHMAALALVDGKAVHGRREILGATLDHEKRFWESAWADRGLSVSEVDTLRVATPRAIAALTLIGGAAHAQEAEEFLHRAVTAESHPTGALFPLPTLLASLRRPYDADHRDAQDRRYLRALEPDLLAEFQLLTLLTELKTQGRSPSAWLQALFPVPFHPNLHPAFVTLGRIAADVDPIDAPVVTDALSTLLSHDVPLRALPCLLACLSVGMKTAHSPLGALLASHLASSGDLGDARMLEPFLPEHSVSLRELSAWVASTLASIPAEIGDDVAALAEQARFKNNESVRFSELGRREEALKAAEEARDLYRRLAKARPDAFEPYLAASLNNVGIRLSELGRREEALKAAEEARDLYWRLAKARPGAFEPDLAMSLNNVGNRLSELGRREEALKAAEEARNLYRRLAKSRPDAFEPDLAMSLNNVGPKLSELGRREEALKAAEEARDLYRRLAKARPDAFEPNLAASLNNVGNGLSQLGRREGALKAAAEARDLYRQLAEARPDAFEPYLAGSLNNVGAMLSELGRREEALKAVEDSAEIYGRLVQKHPESHRDRARMVVQSYIKMCRNLSRAPREDLLLVSDAAFRT